MKRHNPDNAVWCNNVTSGSLFVWHEQGKRVKKIGIALVASMALGLVAGAGLGLGLGTAAQAADPAPTPGPGVTIDKGDPSKWLDKNGDPTYKKYDDGSFDWYTFNGFRRYHAECHVCHGPEGNGSTYAPALAESMKSMPYGEFAAVVASGREIDRPGGQKSVMPALGDNKNVMCYVEDIFVYLKARADGALPGGRPKRTVERSKASQDFENSCTGS